MKVFTQEWIEKAYQHISIASPYRTIPFQYVLAVADQFAELRDQIEHFVGEFPLETRRNLIRKLQTRRADHAVNELRVGFKLRQSGYQISYEPKFLGQTPDWLVSNHNSTLIVEVFTAEYSGVQNTIWENITDLTGRLQEILVPYAIAIRATHSPEKLTESVNMQISQRVSTWLSTQPTIGATRYCLDTEIQVINYNPSYRSLQVIGRTYMDG